MSEQGLGSTAYPPEISAILVNLFKGVLYQEKRELWRNLLDYRSNVSTYVSVLGLEVFIDEAEGYAFLRQINAPDEGNKKALIPRLIMRRALPYAVSLLLILLRKRLLEADASGDALRVSISHREIIEMMRVFMPEKANEVKLVKAVEGCIRRAEEYGFLRQLKGQDEQYEICRIIRAFIDAQWLADMDTILQEYGEHASD